MTAKQYLKQLEWLDGEIHEKQLELEELRARAEGKSAPEATGMPGGSGGSDRIGDTVAKMVDLENYIQKKIDAMAALKANIRKQIDGMPNWKHRIILRHRYVYLKKWEEIEKETGWVERHCRRINKEALEEFEKKYMKGM